MRPTSQCSNCSVRTLCKEGYWRRRRGKTPPSFLLELGCEAIPQFSTLTDASGLELAGRSRTAPARRYVRRRAADPDEVGRANVVRALYPALPQGRACKTALPWWQ